jgi:hypothetical protein
MVGLELNLGFHLLLFEACWHRNNLIIAAELGTAITQSLCFAPARLTALRMDSPTAPTSEMVFSAMAFGGSDSMV